MIIMRIYARSVHRWNLRTLSYLSATDGSIFIHCYIVKPEKGP